MFWILYRAITVRRADFIVRILNVVQIERNVLSETCVADGVRRNSILNPRNCRIYLSDLHRCRAHIVVNEYRKQPKSVSDIVSIPIILPASLCIFDFEAVDRIKRMFI